MYFYLFQKFMEYYSDIEEYRESNKQLSKTEMYRKEAKLLSFQNLKLGQNYYLLDVPFILDSKYHYIHTFIGEFNSTKQPLVMMHGYGGSLAQYYKNYAPLMKKFKIYSIDLPGMGQSSKKNIKLKNYDQTLHYFIDSIEEWRKTLGITKFVIVGHSFGGYLASRYAEKYPQHVRLVFLLSPAGTTIVDEKEVHKSKQQVNQLPWLQQKLYNMLESIWNNRMTPQLLYNQWYGPLLLNQYLNERFEFNDDELELIRDYSEGFLKIPEGSEKGIYQLFDMEHFPKLKAKVPIEVVFGDDIKDLQLVFLFGETDWVDSSGAWRLQEKWGQERVKVFKVPCSGHQISVDNPDFTTEKLLQSLED